MKKILLVSLLVLILSPVSAQLFKIAGHEVGFVYVGPKAGMNFASISNYGTSPERKVGYHLGVVGEIGLTSMLSLEGELLYNSKGVVNDLGFGTKEKIKVNYLGIPLLAKLSFDFVGLSKVYALGGAYANVRTGGSIAFESDTFTEDPLPLTSDEWKRTEWGLVLGAGAEYDIKYGKLGLGLRYEQGVSKMNNVYDNTRSSNFGFSLTFKYDLVDLFFRMKNKRNEEAPSE
ncbi:MAG: PorT family protein [Bacteroidales bacterium]|nr:PorT family protein [Bacteroidales bacterium]MBN2748371.1 PorT family protein [Bacteroidales bacterium]